MTPNRTLFGIPPGTSLKLLYWYRLILHILLQYWVLGRCNSDSPWNISELLSKSHLITDHRKNIYLIFLWPFDLLTVTFQGQTFFDSLWPPRTLWSKGKITVATQGTWRTKDPCLISIQEDIIDWLTGQSWSGVKSLHNKKGARLLFRIWVLKGQILINTMLK